MAERKRGRLILWLWRTLRIWWVCYVIPPSRGSRRSGEALEAIRTLFCAARYLRDEGRLGMAEFSLINDRIRDLTAELRTA